MEEENNPRGISPLMLCVLYPSTNDKWFENNKAIPNIVCRLTYKGWSHPDAGGRRPQGNYDRDPWYWRALANGTDLKARLVPKGLPDKPGEWFEVEITELAEGWLPLYGLAAEIDEIDKIKAPDRETQNRREVTRKALEKNCQEFLADLLK